MILIGLSGKMGVGKDYIAQTYIIPFLKAKYNMSCLQMSFADQIKANVITKRNIAFDDVFVKKTQATRMLLQREGTESGRDLYGKDIWIRYFDTWAKVHCSRGIETIVTTDVRFLNEVEYIKSQGGILVKVVAVDRNERRLQQESSGDEAVYNSIKSHASECELDYLENGEYDFIFENSTGRQQYDLGKQVFDLHNIIEAKIHENGNNI